MILKKRANSHTPMLCFLFGLSLLFMGGCGPAHWTQSEGEVRVLFIGNSYIFVNDMPLMFANLVREGGYEIAVETAAKGGWTLADHAASTETQKLIAEGYCKNRVSFLPSNSDATRRWCRRHRHWLIRSPPLVPNHCFL